MGIRTAVLTTRESPVSSVDIILTEDHEGYHFQYTAEYVASGGTPLAPTMPLQAEEYVKKFMFPVFDGLIPEGWMLDIVDRNRKINPCDRMRHRNQ